MDADDVRAWLQDRLSKQPMNSAIKQYRDGKMGRKTFFRLMAAEGYQQIEALEMARSWEDE